MILVLEEISHFGAARFLTVKKLRVPGAFGNILYGNDVYILIRVNHGSTFI